MLVLMLKMMLTPPLGCCVELVTESQWLSRVFNNRRLMLDWIVYAVEATTPWLACMASRGICRVPWCGASMVAVGLLHTTLSVLQCQRLVRFYDAMTTSLMGMMWIDESLPLLLQLRILPVDDHTRTMVNATAVWV
mmetsp:Transcript_17576/g.35466  ORF Transcript_17576/g.35466 Transcript_17576/m.35466 type:complete len:136 (+) Transcript_17576:149-556(+)